MERSFVRILFGCMVITLAGVLSLVCGHVDELKSSGSPQGRALRMSQRAREHLAEETNPGSSPRALGQAFPGCQVHPLYETVDELMKLISLHGSDADNTTHQELAQGFDALQACSPEESYEIFDAIISHFPEAVFAYIGRGISLARLANKIRAPMESALRDFDHAIKLRPHFYLAFRCRAEALFLAGQYGDAMKDAEKDLHYKHDGSAYVMAGLVSYMLQKDYQATQHLKMAQKFISGHNALSYEYIGRAYMNLGYLRKAIEAMKTALEYEGENIRTLRTLGYLFRNLGDAVNAHHYLDLALKLKSDDVESLEIKGHTFLSSGKPKDAIPYFDTCSRIDPTSSSCVFLRGVAYASLGQFYQAVKACTMAIMSDSCTKEFEDPVHLRDFYRYIHSNLDRTLVEFRYDEELSDTFRNVWAGKIDALHYRAQPGITPHISDVEDVDFQDLSMHAKVLVCRAQQLAPRFQYHADGYMPDERLNVAMALSAMDVGQTLQKYWENPRNYKGWKGRHFSWRDLFEVAVKWRKLVSMDQPVLWMDELPALTLEAGFVTHMIMKAGHTETPRYGVYMMEAVQLAKVMIKSLLGQKLPLKAQDQVLKAASPTDILSVLRRYDSMNQQGGFTVGMQVPSSRPKGGLLHGVMLSISGSSEEDVKLALQRAQTPAQISQYHAELGYVFNQIKDDVSKKKTRDDKERLGNAIIRLAYYFYNFSPLSRGNSAVAFAVAMGAFLASDQEFFSNIPQEKQLEFEAFFAGSPDAFIKRIRSWLTVKSSQTPLEEYPSVSETFPTARSVLELLNAGVSPDLCSKLNGV